MLLGRVQNVFIGLYSWDSQCLWHLYAIDKCPVPISSESNSERRQLSGDALVIQLLPQASRHPEDRGRWYQLQRGQIHCLVPNQTTVLTSGGDYVARDYVCEGRGKEPGSLENKRKQVKNKIIIIIIATERASRCRAGHIKLSSLGLFTSVIYESACVSLFISISPHYK